MADDFSADDVQDAFARALGAPEAERARVLDALRAANPAVADEVASLLEAHAAAGAFLADSPVEAAAAASQVRTAGAWELVEHVASGGMGEVWSARRRDGAFEGRAAVKIVRARLSSGDLDRRFAFERRTLASLDHPHIARLLDGGRLDDGRPWFAMEWVDGAPIDDVVEQRHLDVRARVMLLRDTADAVAHAHGRLVLHRDIKSANVLVDRDLRVRLVDFGIAKLLDGEAEAGITQSGRRWLTPKSASPEQLRDEPITTASDVYALGVLAYAVLTGRHPTSEGTSTPEESMRALLEIDPETPSVVVGDRGVARQLAGDLDAVVLRSLAKDPEARYLTAAEFRDELSRWLAGEDVVARRPGTWEGAMRWCRRHPLVVGAACALVAASALGALLLENATRQEHVATVALRSSEERAAQAEQTAREAESALLRLSDAWLGDELIARAADDLWPLDMATLQDMGDWLGAADDLLSRVPDHRARLESIGSTRDPENAFAAAELATILDACARLADPDAPNGLADVRERRHTVESWSAAASGDHASAWRTAGEAIARDGRFAGLTLTPQLGLVPVGPDPISGLWEFAALRTGDVPSRDREGRLVLAAGSAVVLVLVPGGTSELGAQAVDPTAPLYDPDAHERETRYRVDLAPYLIGKHEVTQSQWLRIAGSDPSRYHARSEFYEGPMQAADSITWLQARDALRRVGLELPTEAQWEHAARAGTTTPVWCGETLDVGDERAGNVADRCMSALRPHGLAPWDDGVIAIAEIGRFAPNPFGLHDVIGNVMEWCRDVYRPPRGEHTPGDALHIVDRGGEYALRGGAFIAPVVDARSSARNRYPADHAAYFVGVRVARNLRGVVP